MIIALKYNIHPFLLLPPSEQPLTVHVVQTRIAGLQSGIEKLRGENSQLVSKYHEKEKEVETVRGAIAKLQRRAVEAETLHKASANAQQVLSESVTRLERELDFAKASFEGEKQALVLRLHEGQADLGRLHQGLQRCKEDVITSRATANEETVRVRQELETARSALQTALEEKSNLAEALSAAMRRQEDALLETSSTREQEQLTLQESLSMTAQLTKRLESTMQQSTQAQEQLELLRRQLVDKDGTIEGLTQSVSIEKTISDTGAKKDMPYEYAPTTL